MASTADIAKRYFAALSAHDLDAAVALWKPGSIDRFVGGQELVAPDGIVAYFSELFGAFPDFELEVVELTTARNRTAVRWTAHGTFAGPGRFQGFTPNQARIAIEGCDVITVTDELIVHNDAYVDSGDLARQLGLLPAAGSPAEVRLTRLANVRTKALRAMHGVSVEAVADGVWVVRGGFPIKTMNVYLIRDGSGVTVFDAGIKAMGPALAAVCAQHGGARRVVLGHADPDHRGAAPALGVPVFCHPLEHETALKDQPLRDYWDMGKLRPYARPYFKRMLPAWDGGAVAIEGTVGEGDEVAGFEVVELPGHAPGLIGLFRRSDRLALISDTVYTLDIQTGRKGGPRIPHPAFDDDVEQARASIRKLAALDPERAWAGHADPVTGDVRRQLQEAAEASVP
ncbi:MAG TPA: nuclear transport factor 2 family protein [Solirubrobacteraceae bacterium]|nr:nuclear transport factor 2 family protein [Solirubrobacteraceae bacterium]